MSRAVRLSGITVRFGAVTALEDVDLEVEAGTLHAVVGENGAGKTTLMRVLYGAQRPSEGGVEVEGKPQTFGSSADAITAGVGMVSQHYAIIPELTCLQNLMLGAEPGAVPNQSAARTRATELAERMGFHFEWDRPAEELGPAGAQKLEILKLLWRKARIMILDEPTAMLSPQDGEALFESLHKLVAEGATVILVTHRLPEVLNHCQRVTVLRAGKRVADLPVSETDSASLAGLIVGGGVPVSDAIDANRTFGSVALHLKDVTVRDPRGHDALKNANLEVREGEVVGIAGVDGNGQRELFHAIIGTAALQSGAIEFVGKDISGTGTAERLVSGLRVVPEDRHEEGVIEAWSLEENSALGLQRLAPLAAGGKIDLSARHRWAEATAARFKTRHGGLRLPMSSLSGGNQQRFVAARALELGPKLLLAFSPARGLDLKGTADVYGAIREKAKGGMAALVVSFDLDELLEHCDRILVLNRGLLTQPASRNREAVGREMVGT